MRLGAAAGGRAVRLTLKDENVWKSAFTGVPADLYYSVWEDPVPEYTTTYSGDAATGFVITNTYTEGVTDPGVPPEPTPPATVQPEDDPLTPGPSEEDPLEKPDEEEPKIPQTGQEVLPVYAMMAAGILFVLLGLTDLCRRQECCDEED